MRGAMRAPHLGGWVAVLLLGAGCAADPATRLRLAERDHQTLTREREASTRAVESVRAYAAELRSPGASGRSFSLYASPAAVEQMAAQLFPMRLAARSFHNQLTGEVIIERLSGVRFGPDNTLTCVVEMRGENIRYTGKVPKAYQTDVNRFQSGVAAGVVADMVVELSLGADGALSARAQATRTRLKANSNATSEGMLRSEMNERALRLPFVFELTPPAGGVLPRRMVLTAQHLVVTYTP